MKPRFYHHIITAVIATIVVMAVIILLGEQSETCTFTQFLLWKGGALITIWVAVRILTRMDKNGISLFADGEEE